MGGFRLVCRQCGSDKVIEKSSRSKLDWSADRIKYGEGIKRICLDCNNEAFIIFKTWLQ